MSAESVTVEDAQRPFFAGVDVGGTSIKVGVVDDLGRTLAFTSFATEDEKGPEFAINRMRRVIEELLSSASLTLDDLAAIGLGTPGTMDIPRGMILDPFNMPGWQHFPIRDALKEATGKPVAYANDAGAAAYGEFWVGSGREFDIIVLLTLGTGVGGGIIIEGRSLDGVNSHGSECGHIIVDANPDARICGCGRRGHLEAYASATALIKRTEEALAAGKTSSLANRMVNGETLNGLMIFKEASAGDALAREMIMETADYLSTGCVNVIHTIDPGAVILGGAMNFGGHNTEIGAAFLKRVQEKTKERIFPVQAKNIVIDYAQLGGDAGYIGAAGIARSLFSPVLQKIAPL